MKAQGVEGIPCPSHHGWIFPGYCLTRVRAWGTKTRVRMLKDHCPQATWVLCRQRCPSLLCCHHRHLPLDQRSGEAKEVLTPLL